MEYNEAKILDGKRIAAALQVRIADNARQVTLRKGRKPCLCVVLVGDNAASKVYVANKAKAAARCGIDSHMVCLDKNTRAKEIISELEQASNNEDIDGIILQLPLPGGKNPEEFINKIPPAKDIDGLTLRNTGSLWAGKTSLLRPCTPSGVMFLLKEAIGSNSHKRGLDFDMSGMKAMVVGRSRLVGRPLATMLLQKNATVTVCHKKTGKENLDFYARNADVIVSAAGAPGLINADMVKPGAIVIDVGITKKKDGRIVGDVDFAAVAKVASVITPVPGGVGPMTISFLLHNTVLAAAQKIGMQNKIQATVEG